ncbi:MAG: diphosphate--fructose-6-phosphate 1-phosphotransferase, partial [FCB group bacterium]|nr:diphosphate--fructose-6-phosphate 1-phosphotransferase [FCB group bacterium]
MTQRSVLHTARSAYKPKLPAVFPAVEISQGAASTPAEDADKIKSLFPHTFGLPVVTFEPGTKKAYEPLHLAVILSGGQAPGGHNVIAGLFDGLKACHPDSKLYGFLGGPSGLVNNRYIEIDAALIDAYRNTGGFDIIGSGRTKLEKKEQYDATLHNCKALGIHALVVIGGDDSNTNAAVLAEYYKEQDAGLTVIGVPKTIDGDLKNDMIEASFGFDTATKVYSELIGNIERDANSAKKYWHIIKLMGRSASHIALECALRTHPNYAIISEEVAAGEQTLHHVVEDMARVIIDRSANGHDFGVAIVPEGLIEFIPEMKVLISELNDLLAKHEKEIAAIGEMEQKRKFICDELKKESAELYRSLPKAIAEQLIMERDPHGNVQVSLIETDKLLVWMIEAYLEEAKKKGEFKGKFKTHTHFFGYEGRCSFPSNFDADYTYSLGYTASLLAANACSGYMSSVRNLLAPAKEWIAGGIPMTSMMNMERRHGKEKPVIRKALVDLNGKPFRTFASQRETW